MAEPAHRNSFDALRMLGALAVFHSHFAGMLTGAQPTFPVLGDTLGGLGVTLFFAISGYLVTESLKRDPDPMRFLSARALRIYPGLAAALIACILGGLAISRLGPLEYLTDPRTARFLASNLTSLLQARELSLPGVFDESRWKFANGSLWTVAYEIAFYVGILVAHRLCRREYLPAFLLAALTVCVAVNSWVPATPGVDLFRRFDPHFAAQFGICFLSGSLLSIMDPRAIRDRTLALAAIATLLLWGTPPLNPIAHIWAAFLFIEIGRSQLLAWYGRLKVGDLSYGVYLYAYPLSNVATTYFDGILPGKVLEAATLVMTLGLASLSWQLIERPALALKRRRGSCRAPDAPAAA